MKNYINLNILLSVLLILTSGCNSLKKDYIDKFNPNGRLSELQIDSKFKQEIMGDIVNKRVNEDLIDELNEANNNGLVNYFNDALYELSIFTGETIKEKITKELTKKYQSRFDYMMYIISNYENIDSVIANPPLNINIDNEDQNNLIDNENISTQNNSEIKKKQKENEENIEYVLEVLSNTKYLVDDIVFSELKLISKGENYQVYEFSVLNNVEEFESLTFKVKVEFNEDGMYSSWKGI